MKILVLAAHPDDEVLGMGATIKKMSKEGHEIFLLVVTEGATAQYKDEKMIQVRKTSCIKSSKILGITGIEFLEFPDMLLDSIPQLELNKKIEDVIKKLKPKVVFTTPFNDLNTDHKIVFNSTLVATRPQKSSVTEIISYELPGFKNKSFEPNLYINVEKEFVQKIKAFKQYKSEIEKFPHPRSIEAITNQAIFRGIESGQKKSEAFKIIKKIL